LTFIAGSRKTISFVVYQKKHTSTVKLAVLRNMLKKGLQEYLYIKFCAMSQPLTAYSISFSGNGNSRNLKKTLMTLHHQMTENIQME